eukprot:547146-Pyramimonas_sp.AAC.2
MLSESSPASMRGWCGSISVPSTPATASATFARTTSTGMGGGLLCPVVRVRRLASAARGERGCFGSSWEDGRPSAEKVPALVFCHLANLGQSNAFGMRWCVTRLQSPAESRSTAPIAQRPSAGDSTPTPDRSARLSVCALAVAMPAPPHAPAHEFPPSATKHANNNVYWLRRFIV